MKKSMTYLFFLLIATTFIGCSKWNTNYDNAFEKAKNDGKPVLVYFDASAWDEGSKTFDESVLGTKDFEKKASEIYTLVKIVLPDDPNKELSDAEKQAVDLVSKYKLQMIPAIYLHLSTGEPYAMPYFSPSDELTVDAVLAKLSEYDAVKTAAEAKIAEINSKESNLEKAKAIEEYIRMSDENVYHFTKPYMEQVLDLTRDDEDPEAKDLFYKFTISIADITASDLFQAQKLDEAFNVFTELMANTNLKPADTFTAYYMMCYLSAFKGSPIEEINGYAAKAKAADPKNANVPYLEELLVSIKDSYAQQAEYEKQMQEQAAAQAAQADSAATEDAE